MQKRAKSSFSKKMGAYFSHLKMRVHTFFEALYEKIWTPTEAAVHTPIMRVFTGVWRTVEITINGTISNNIPMQAAALTYYALMALAPLVMLVLTIFGIVMNVQGEEAVNLVQERIVEALLLVMPEPATAAGTEAGTLAHAGTQALDGAEYLASNVAPQFQEFTRMLLNNTRMYSGSTGIIGTLVLVILAIFMLARVEDAYNLIWNVKNRRSWPLRFLVYFLFLVIGGILFAVTMSLLSISAILAKISEHTTEICEIFKEISGGEFLLDVMTSFVPGLIAFVVMAILFACVNRYLPHIGVNWRPALLGGAFVALSFIVCGRTASLFVGKISEFNSVYGNLSVIFILMFALYLSWMFLLLGGQVAYATQNARYFKNINRKWEELSTRSRQQVYFSCLFEIFSICEKADKGPTMEELGMHLGIPANLVSECIATLLDEKMIVALNPEMDENGRVRYNTVGGIGKRTIAELRQKFDNFRVGIQLGGNAQNCAARRCFLKAFDNYPERETLEDLLKKE